MDKLRRNARDGRGRPLVLSEGDSWFAFPKELRPGTMDILERKLDLVLMRLEKNGDEVSTMLTGKQRKRLEYYLTRWPFEVLLFSGGGNDIVGDHLYPLLNTVSGSYTWRDAVNEDALAAAFTLIKGYYRELIALRDRLRPECWIITHCYDYPIPNKDGAIQCLNRGLIGPWLYTPMADKGVNDPAKQRTIAKHLIQTHKEMLRDLAAEHERFVLVNTIGTVGENNWGDEIHPDRAGFERVAEKIGAEIAKRFPTAAR